MAEGILDIGNFGVGKARAGVIGHVDPLAELMHGGLHHTALNPAALVSHPSHFRHGRQSAVKHRGARPGKLVNRDPGHYLGVGLQ